MTLKIALLAATSLILVAFYPHANEKRTIEAMRRVRRALMKGVVHSICPEYCHFFAGKRGHYPSPREAGRRWPEAG